MTPDPDLDELDSNWGDEPEEEEEEEHDVDAAWGEVGPKHRTEAEKAVARKVKAQQRDEKRKSRDALIADKQKKKQPKKRPSEAPPEPKKKKVFEASPRADEPRAESRVEARADREKRSRTTLIVIVAVVAIAAALAFFLSKR